jgi:hypothetical protein
VNGDEVPVIGVEVPVIGDKVPAKKPFRSGDLDTMSEYRMK